MSPSSADTPSHLTPTHSASTQHQPKVQVKLLDPRAAVPVYQTSGAAGLDLAACLPESTPSITIQPGKIAVIPTGLAIAIQVGFEAQVRPRSGLSTKHGITLPNAPGTIDCDYRGEVLVPLINHSSEPFAITHGMRIAQMVIAPVSHASIQVVNSLETTQRGTGGFGSTGHN